MDTILHQTYSTGYEPSIRYVIEMDEKIYVVEMRCHAENVSCLFHISDPAPKDTSCSLHFKDDVRYELGLERLSRLGGPERVAQLLLSDPQIFEHHKQNIPFWEES